MDHEVWSIFYNYMREERTQATYIKSESKYCRYLCIALEDDSYKIWRMKRYITFTSEGLGEGFSVLERAKLLFYLVSSH
jgi:hypothetical protein